MFKKSKQSGFTLIELLVVIAIIGVLASIILVALNSARNKGNDARVKANLSNLRTAAELYYDTNNNFGAYVNLCTAGMFNNSTVRPFVDEANYSGYVAGDFSCHASLSTLRYAVSVKLLGGGFWCVDSGGSAKQIAAALGLDAFVCP